MSDTDAATGNSMARFADILLAYRGIAWIVLFAATAIATVGLGLIDYDDEPRIDFRQSGTHSERLEKLFRDFGPEDNDLLVVIDGDDLFTTESIRSIRRLVASLQAMEGVDSVFSIFDVRRRGSFLVPLIPVEDAASDRLLEIRDRALVHPAVAGHMLSSDAKTMLVWLRLRNDITRTSELEPHIQQVRSAANQVMAGSKLRARLAGHPVARVYVLRTIRLEMERLVIVSALIGAVSALLFFRSLAAVFISIAGPLLGSLWIVGAIGWVGLKINGLNAALPSLVFVIGFTDSVHLLFEMRRGRSTGSSPLSAAHDAIREIGPACTMTSLTTAVGFGSLAIAELESVQQFGAVCALGTLLTFCAVITIVPLLASTWLGELIVRPRMVAPADVADSNDNDWTSKYLRLFRWPRLIVLLSTIVTVGLIAAASTLKPDMHWMEMLPEESETVQVTRHCDQAFGGSLFAYVVVEWPQGSDLETQELLDVIAEIHAAFEEDGTLEGPFSILNLLHSFSSTSQINDWHIRQLDAIPKTMRDRIIRSDLHRNIVTAHVPDAGASALLPVFSRFDEKLARIQSRHPGFRLYLTGTSVVATRNLHHMISDLGRSLALATVILFIMMTLAFGSFRLGLISVIPNAFPLAFTAGLLALIDEPLRLTSAMTFSICLGIAVDDTIHLLTRFRREQLADSDARVSTQRALRTAGVAMFVTSIILLGGFFAMMVSQMPPLSTFGQLAGLAIVAALVGDLVILPALLLCIGSVRK